MQDEHSLEQDRVFSFDEFKQFDRLNQNTNSRIPIFFCVDVSASMKKVVNFGETRLSLLSKVMRRLLENMKNHPVLSERAVIGVVTYNNRAVLQQTALDLAILNIDDATNFVAENQTIFSLGLRCTIQAIDQYRESIRRSDVETFTPILVFMTDGEPVGDSDSEIEAVYNEIWRRVQRDDLYVFPIGISQEARMSYVKALSPADQWYQMINESDFIKVFGEIERIVCDKPSSTAEEKINMTKMASKLKDTKDTGSGTSFILSDLAKIVEEHKEKY